LSGITFAIIAPGTFLVSSDSPVEDRPSVMAQPVATRPALNWESSAFESRVRAFLLISPSW
jgi:hypothetical protein